MSKHRHSKSAKSRYNVNGHRNSLRAIENVNYLKYHSPAH